MRTTFLKPFLLAVILYTLTVYGGNGTATLNPGETLNQGEGLDSGNLYFADMQSDGNFVLYSRTTALWSSNTDGKGSPPYKIIMQLDNNLVIYDGFNRVMWASNTYDDGIVGAKLCMQTDGNLVIYDGHNTAIWATNTDNARIDNNTTIY
mmetsp:Transcript_83613/g.102466  ORF Transcript_83613/g.102466 Transcript_83613/m.102466 type:complete len:150 (+) Transcript_83613:120-569(+)